MATLIYFKLYLKTIAKQKQRLYNNQGHLQCYNLSNYDNVYA